MEFQADLNYAKRLDKEDSLAPYRNQFNIPKDLNGQECIYLCGNSLGLQPKKVRQYLEDELDDWAQFGVEGHFEARHPWMPYHEFLTEQTARLVGAKPKEVVIMNTLTVNLHLMMVSFYRPTPQRHKILIEANAFPSDQYAVQSQIEFHGYNFENALLELPLGDGEAFHREEDILHFIEKKGDSIALIMLGGVNYYSGQVFNMARIAEAGHKKGCIVGFDLAHAAGNLVLNLHASNVDFAAWCSYKYLNGGPGCIAGCFVHERHADNSDLPRFSGWWGQNKQTRFLMESKFEAIPGAEGWQLSNPPILPMAALRASMELFDEVGMTTLRKKSKKLTGYLDFLLQNLADSVSLITPGLPEERGCQLSIQVKEGGKKLHAKLKKNNVICDWREPDVIRVAPVPLYNSFEDVFRFAEILSQLLDE